MILLLAASVWIIALLIASSRSVTLSKAKGLRVAEILPHSLRSGSSSFARNDSCNLSLLNYALTTDKPARPSECSLWCSNR